MKALSAILVTFLVLSPVQAGYSGGSGTAEDPYEIATAADLIALGETPEDYGKHFILTAEISLAPYLPGRKVFDEAVIGPHDGQPFTGVFDGDGNKISNLTVVGEDCLGLFGRLGSGAKVVNVDVVSVKVFGSGDHVGGLVGYNEGGRIEECHSSGSVTGSTHVGGLVGFSWGDVADCQSSGAVDGAESAGGLVGMNCGTVVVCSSTSSVNGEEDAGGLIGVNNEGHVAGCFSTGAVRGRDAVGGLVGGNSGVVARSYSSGPVGDERSRLLGGLVGTNDGRGEITECYSTGRVSGDKTVGGLVGYNQGSVAHCYSAGAAHGIYYVGGLVGANSGQLNGCYSVGRVSGDNALGGLVGSDGGNVVVCFWDIQTSGQARSAGGGMGRPTIEMRMADTFFCWAVYGGGGLWTFDSGNDYPRLWWEEEPGDVMEAVELSDLWAGSGTFEDPYLIHTPQELNVIGLLSPEWGKHFRLTADIDLRAYKGTAFNIIGRQDMPFSGVLHGDRYVISNFSCVRVDTGHVGLFACLSGGDAEIKGLRLIAPEVDAQGGDCIGALIGRMGEGTIVDCHVEGGSVQGQDAVGTLVGKNDDGQVVRCSASGVVGGHERVGGLVGSNGGAVDECYSIAAVTGRRNAVGGLAGYNQGSLTDCYSGGAIDGSEAVGGFVGTNGGILAQCYSNGPVRGAAASGGLVGHNEGNVMGCFWDIETSGQISSAGGAGKKTAEMQTAQTFLDMRWDFADEMKNGRKDLWRILEGWDYPRLVWELWAFSPDPSVGAVDVIQPMVLNWLPAKDAFYHDIYFGEDANAVASATRQTIDLYFGQLPVEMTTFDPGGMGYGQTYYWRVDEGSEDDPGSPWQGSVWMFTTADCAISPNPSDGATNVGRQIVLGWVPGGPGLQYDVYFGQNEETVAKATTESPDVYCGRQPPQGTTYQPQDLDWFKTYYWRVDGVDQAYPNQRWKGNVWSFRTVNVITWHDPADGAIDVSCVPVLSWVPVGPHLQYDVYFGDDETIVANATPESAGIYHGRQLPEMTTYEPGGLRYNETYYWRIDAISETDPSSSWRGDVWSFTTVDFIWAMHPSDGAVGVSRSPILSWVARGPGLQYDVYLGADEEMIANATPESLAYQGRLAEEVTTYEPGILGCNETYYWRIDEVNETDPDSPWKGPVWSFTTASVIIVLVIDDFESYADDMDSPAVWEVWIDGWFNGTGSQVGYLEAPFVERTIIHGGRQSMPFFYNNTGTVHYGGEDEGRTTAFYSEAEREFRPVQNWTVDGADTLTLHFHGRGDNLPDSLYAGIEDKTGHITMVHHPDANALLVAEWQKWHIALADFQATGVDVSSVKRLYIGVGNRDNPQPGSAGLVFIDDIWVTNRMP